MYVRKRRSIMHDAPNHWVGWTRIENLYAHACKLEKNLPTKTNSLYFTTLFETGGRKSEVIQLRPDQFSWNEDLIKIENMEVLKRRVRYTRNVFIKIEENPLAYPLIDYVEDCDTRYLLPGYTAPFSIEIDPDKHISTTHVYNKITEINPDIWPHWLRDQRSWHLSAPVEEGGRGLDAFLLKQWFHWASMEMPAIYAGRRSDDDILEHLELEDIRSE